MKILKSEINFLKSVFFALPILFIMFMILFAVSFDNQKGYWTWYQQEFQDSETKALDFYYAKEFFFPREIIDFKVTLIPNEFFSLFEGFYSNIYAKIDLKPLGVYTNLKTLHTGGRLGIYSLSFYALVVLYGLGFSTSKSFKALSGTYGKKKIFWLLSLTKIAVCVTFFIFVIAGGVITGALFGFNILHPPLFVFLFVSVLLIILSFAIGLLFSMLYKHLIATLMVGILLILILIFPENSFIFPGKTETPEQYIHEFDLNYNLMLKTDNVEMEFKTKFGKTVTVIEPSVLEKFIDEYIGEDIKKLFDYETEKIKREEEEVKRFSMYDSLSPLAFYASLCAEMSNGHKSKIALYRKAMDYKQKYIRWNLKRRILKTMKKEIHPIFTKDSDENILYATPALPFSFVPGLLFITLYIFLFFFVAYLLYLKARDSVPELDTGQDG